MYLTGQLLIAAPAMLDDRFEKTVLFMCGHDQQGAMGLVLNKPIANITFKTLLAELNIDYEAALPDLPIYLGGPVENGRGFVLHSEDVILDSSIKVAHDCYLSASLDMLDLIAAHKGPRDKLIFLGYSAWAENQLDDEIKQNTWLHYCGDNSTIFYDDRQTLWTQLYEYMNINPIYISSQIGHG